MKRNKLDFFEIKNIKTCGKRKGFFLFFNPMEHIDNKNKKEMKI